MKNSNGKNIRELSQTPGSSLKVNSGNGGSVNERTGFDKYLVTKKKKLNKEDIVKGILEGDRVILGRALSLIESTRADDNELSKTIINECLPHSGNSVRVGITGVPGSGKSTFIEALGLYLLSAGKKIAVMAVDPSSSRTGGSLMGDKTRMEKLSGHKDVFIRPSATSGFLGGVNRATREAIILAEAAGHDVILVETVGVGQSEILVHSMVDFFLLLQIAGAGDELQGIKKGIMEMADAIAVTKADGDNVQKAELCKKEIENALHYSLNYDEDWTIPVLTVSAIENRSVKELWDIVQDHAERMKESGRFSAKRKEQTFEWMRHTIIKNLENEFYNSPDVKAEYDKYKSAVLEGKISPVTAVEELISIFKS
ncbi:MAG: methylmalonyl Co-A mutase-associated GTPase MeaB [Candidatus Delongbacteria bacterium]